MTAISMQTLGRGRLNRNGDLNMSATRAIILMLIAAGSLAGCGLQRAGVREFGQWSQREPRQDAPEPESRKKPVAANAKKAPKPARAAAPAIKGSGGDLASVNAPPPSLEGVKPDFIWPVQGLLSSKFGLRGGRKHDGIDIAAPLGTPVYAAEAGEVVYADEKYRGYGKLVLIRHAGDIITVYAHNHVIRVKQGQKVAKGHHIADVGSTGHSSTPHLHFEVRVSAKPSDPLQFLPK
ncbi:MAG: hypothetical protein GMKNLPBB_01137 [Myxococcota bacterium]|nr:hypothetical protein [Myxococcota bacterium]